MEASQRVPLTPLGLSRQKWRKYDKSFRTHLLKHGKLFCIAEKESEKPRYSQASLHIAVVGAPEQNRHDIICTAHGRSISAAATVKAWSYCASRRGAEQLEMMETCYEEAKVQDGLYTINGIDTLQF